MKIIDELNSVSDNLFTNEVLLNKNNNDLGNWYFVEAYLGPPKTSLIEFSWCLTRLFIVSSKASLVTAHSSKIRSCYITAEERKLSTTEIISKCDQIRRKLRIWSYLWKKSLMKNFNFCAVLIVSTYLFGASFVLQYTWQYIILCITHVVKHFVAYMNANNTQTEFSLIFQYS